MGRKYAREDEHPRSLVVSVGDWALSYYPGSHTADVHHRSRPGVAIECIGVGGWDGREGGQTVEVTEALLRDELRSFIAEHGREYLDNVVLPMPRRVAW